MRSGGANWFPDVDLDGPDPVRKPKRQHGAGQESDSMPDDMRRELTHRRTQSSHRLFMHEFLRAPWQVGAVAPSSRHLAAAMVEPIPRIGAAVVVELGPGTGVFTRHIETRLAGQGRQLAIEVNPVLAARLARQHPAVEVVRADARHLPELLGERGITEADVIVSGLPWVGFDSATQQALLHAVCAVLGADGVFVTFGYAASRWTPPARRFRQLVRQAFDEVVIGRTIRRNVPPAFVYYARRPIGCR
jgi:phospholipid N-methyltransferase